MIEEFTCVHPLELAKAEAADQRSTLKCTVFKFDLTSRGPSSHRAVGLSPDGIAMFEVEATSPAQLEEKIHLVCEAYVKGFLARGALQ